MHVCVQWPHLFVQNLPPPPPLHYYILAIQSRNLAKFSGLYLFIVASAVYVWTVKGGTVLFLALIPKISALCPSYIHFSSRDHIQATDTIVQQGGGMAWDWWNPLCRGTPATLEMLLARQLDIIIGTSTFVVAQKCGGQLLCGKGIYLRNGTHVCMYVCVHVCVGTEGYGKERTGKGDSLNDIIIQTLPVEGYNTSLSQLDYLYSPKSAIKWPHLLSLLSTSSSSHIHVQQEEVSQVREKKSIALVDQVPP